MFSHVDAADASLKSEIVRGLLSRNHLRLVAYSNGRVLRCGGLVVRIAQIHQLGAGLSIVINVFSSRHFKVTCADSDVAMTLPIAGGIGKRDVGAWPFFGQCRYG